MWSNEEKHHSSKALTVLVESFNRLASRRSLARKQRQHRRVSAGDDRTHKLMSGISFCYVFNSGLLFSKKSTFRIIPGIQLCVLGRLVSCIFILVPFFSGHWLQRHTLKHSVSSTWLGSGNNGITHKPWMDADKEPKQRDTLKCQVFLCRRNMYVNHSQWQLFDISELRRPVCIPVWGVEATLPSVYI